MNVWEFIFESAFTLINRIQASHDETSTLFPLCVNKHEAGRPLVSSIAAIASNADDSRFQSNIYISRRWGFVEDMTSVLWSMSLWQDISDFAVFFWWCFTTHKPTPRTRLRRWFSAEVSWAQKKSSKVKQTSSRNESLIFILMMMPQFDGNFSTAFGLCRSWTSTKTPKKNVCWWNEARGRRKLFLSSSFGQT